jgi:hypothetical protein
MIHKRKPLLSLRSEKNHYGQKSNLTMRNSPRLRPLFKAAFLCIEIYRRCANISLVLKSVVLKEAAMREPLIWELRGSASAKPPSSAKFIDPADGSVSLLDMDSDTPTFPTSLRTASPPHFDHPDSFDIDLMVAHLGL